MKLADALAGVSHLFLDSAPLIYLVEAHPRYLPVIAAVVGMIEARVVVGVTSPVTLAECLVVPYRHGSHTLVERYAARIVGGYNTRFTLIDEHIAQHAAELRARYNLRLADAFQTAVALQTDCEALLTNDASLRRVSELRMLIVEDLEL